MVKYVISMFLLGVVALIFVNADELVVKVPAPEGGASDKRSGYYYDVLHLALDKTAAKYGPYRIDIYPEVMQQDRALKTLETSDKVNVYWSMTSAERESNLLPVRFPLLKGLLGYRVFIINKDAQPIFDKVKSLNDLKSLVAGQGVGWPDVDILRSNGLKVDTASSYDNMFPMLKLKRFDYFPRGVNEITAEVEHHKDLGLVAEKRLLLRYHAPVFFFVKKTDAAIAKRITEGLEIALNDGSFDQLFYNDPFNRAIFDQVNIKGRLIFDLENPLLTEETRNLIKEKTKWFDIGVLK